MLDLIPAAVANLVAQVAPYLPVALPVGVLLAAVYLLANDALDVLLLASDGGWHWVKLVAIRDALVHDVANQAAISAAALGALGALAAGGNIKAQLSASLVAVAASNVANLERSTLGKLSALVDRLRAPRPPRPAVEPTPDPLAVEVARLARVTDQLQAVQAEQEAALVARAKDAVALTPEPEPPVEAPAPPAPPA